MQAAFSLKKHETKQETTCVFHVRCVHPPLLIHSWRPIFLFIELRAVPSGVPAYRRICLLLRPERRTGVSALPRLKRHPGVFCRFPPPGGVPAYHPRISMPPRCGVPAFWRTLPFPAPGRRIGALPNFPSGTSEISRIAALERRIGAFPLSRPLGGVTAYRRISAPIGVPAYRRKAVLRHYLHPR